jgi:hypothetical protein
MLLALNRQRLGDRRLLSIGESGIGLIAAASGMPYDRTGRRPGLTSSSVAPISIEQKPAEKAAADAKRQLWQAIRPLEHSGLELR